MRKKKALKIGLTVLLFLASLAGCNTKENADEGINPIENPLDQELENLLNQAQGFPSESLAKPTESLTVVAPTEQAQEIERIEVTPVMGEPYHEQVEEWSSPVSLHWAEDVIKDYPFDEFCADESEWQSNLAFMTKQRVTDFTVYAINLQDVDTDGTAIFSEEELYQQKELTPDRAFVLHMTFWGDMPSYGISFVEEDGTVRHFAIADSGYDGSLLLIEY